MRLRVDGPALIAGAGNGDPRSFEPFQDSDVDLFYGKAMVILRADAGAGRARLTATADGLDSGAATIQIRAAP